MVIQGFVVINDVVENIWSLEEWEITWVEKNIQGVA